MLTINDEILSMATNPNVASNGMPRTNNNNYNNHIPAGGSIVKQPQNLNYNMKDNKPHPTQKRNSFDTDLPSNNKISSAHKPGFNNNNVHNHQHHHNQQHQQQTNRPVAPHDRARINYTDQVPSGAYRNPSTHHQQIRPGQSLTPLSPIAPQTHNSSQQPFFINKSNHSSYSASSTSGLRPNNGSGRPPGPSNQLNQPLQSYNNFHGQQKNVLSPTGAATNSCVPSQRSPCGSNSSISPGSSHHHLPHPSRQTGNYPPAAFNNGANFQYSAGGHQSMQQQQQQHHVIRQQNSSHQNTST